MKKYQSINQFVHLIRSVKDKTRFIGLAEDGTPMFDHNKELPTLKCTATTKLHGTNAAVRLDLATNEITMQSRERELSLTSDNAGFCTWASQEHIQKEFKKMFEKIKEENPTQFVDSIVIFGEWAGKNIQAGVALTGLPQMFCLFEVHLCDGDERVRLSPTKLNLVPVELNALSIYDVSQFGTWVFEIDFNKPEIAQNELVELCAKIEEECPAGKFFGVSGVGEGFVLTHNSDFGFFQCKVKGSKHSGSKVKKTASIDIEKFSKVDEFLESVLDNGRLMQGINYLKEMQIPLDMPSIGAYIKWINGDISKEHMDSIVESQLDMKLIAARAAPIAKKFFIQHLNENA